MMDFLDAHKIELNMANAIPPIPLKNAHAFEGHLPALSPESISTAV
jgi:hypothetical protein